MPPDAGARKRMSHQAVQLDYARFCARQAGIPVGHPSLPDWNEGLGGRIAKPGRYEPRSVPRR